MINKKLASVLGIAGGLVVLSIIALNFSDTKFLQGRAERQKKQEANSGTPWWCIKSDKGDEGEIDKVPPERTENDRGSQTGSTSNPGKGRGGILRFDPNSYSFKQEEAIGTRKVPQSAFSEPFIAWKYGAIPTVQGGSGGSGGSGKSGDGPKVPPIDPKKIKIKDYHECSCDASTFEVPSLKDYNFPCPNPGETKIFETADEKGMQHEITGYTPPQEACQKPLKEDETVNIWYQCGCDETEFYEPKTGQTYQCPGGGMAKQYGDQKQYFIHVWKIEEYQCSDEWKCPEGYEEDWKTIENDCSKLKANDCSGKKLFKTKSGAEKACKAFQGWKMNKQCEDLNKCKKSIDLFYNKLVPTGDPAYKDLPHPWNCEQLYGGSTSDIWN